jgi:hypothetical protein
MPDLKLAETQDCPPTYDLFRFDSDAPAADQEPQALWRACRTCTRVMAAATLRDGWTGRVLPERLSATLARIDALVAAPPNAFEGDSLTRIVMHCAEAMERILRRPRTRLERAHQVMPLYRVRDLDSASLTWLAHQPGVTVRQKLGQRQRMLGLVRTASLNVPENRVLRHLAEALKPLLSERLKYASGQSGSDVVLLGDSLQLCRTAIADADRAGISVHRVERPNNALMADPSYRRIWQAWTWLSRHRHDLVRSWDEAMPRLAETMLWTLAARLNDRATVTIHERLVVRESGFGDEGFGVHTIDGGGHELEIWIEPARAKSPGSPRLVRLSRDNDAVAISEFPLIGSGAVLRIGDPLLRTVRLKPSGVKGGRLDCRVEVLGAKSPGLPHARADGAGLRAAADAIIGGLLQVAAARRAVTPATQDARLIGLDCSGVIPRLMADSSALKTQALLSAGRYALAGGRQQLTGEDGRLFPPFAGEGSWRSAPAILDGFRNRDESPEASDALTRIFQALWTSTLRTGADSTHHGQRELAVAVSGLLPDIAQRHLREIAGAAGGFAETWLVDRSIAAALGWQSSWLRAPPFNDATRVLIVDAEAGALRMSPLQALTDRSDPRLAAPPYHGVFWSRDLKLEPFADQPRLTGRAWQRDYLELALEPAIKQGLIKAPHRDPLIDWLIEQGEAERLERGGIIHLKLPTGGDASHVLRIAEDPALVERASAIWLARYQGWLREMGHQLVSALREWSGPPPEGRKRWRDLPWRVLYAGRPFHREALQQRMRDIWREEIVGRGLGQFRFEHHFRADADRLVVLGCHSFLQRHIRAAPAIEPPIKTWEDVLPALYLESESDTGFRELCILPEGPAAPGMRVRYEVQEDLDLSAGAARYLLPVLRGAGEHQVVLHNALLASPSFPLKNTLKVKLDVEYLYGANDYRLRIKPAAEEAGARAPFDRLEARWVTIVNRAPQFAPVDAGERLRDSLGRAAAALRSLRPGPTLEAGEIATLMQSLRNASVLPVAPDPSPAGARIADLQQQAATIWLPFLENLILLWTQTDGDARERISEQLAACIGHLGIALPATLTKLLSEVLDGRETITQNKAMRIAGRLLRDSGDDVELRLVGKILSIAQQRLRWTVKSPTHRFDLLNPPSGALALILNSAPGFLLRLRPAQLESILKLCRAALDAIRNALVTAADGAEDGWLHATFIAYRNIGEILVGLLRARELDGVDEAARRLMDAGTSEMHWLARRIYEIDAIFEPLKFERPDSRLTLDGAEDNAHEWMYALSFLLYRLLAGHDPERLIRISDPVD